MNPKRIEGKSAQISDNYPSVVDAPAGGLSTLSDFFLQVSDAHKGVGKIYARPEAADFDALRSQIEGPSVRPDDAAPRVPSFTHELLPILKTHGNDPKHWKSTLDDIQSHYENRRKEFESIRLQALATIHSSADLSLVQQQQQRVRNIEAALRTIGQEIDHLERYRRHQMFVRE